MGLNKKGRTKRALLISSFSLLAVVLLLAGGCLAFLLNCYRADTSAIEAFSAAYGNERRQGDGYIAVGDADAAVGFIFYPGAKVECEAYLPLLEACAARGMLCILVEMPLYFPLINGDAAANVRKDFSEVQRWYIGGHSLGGYAASGHVAENADDYEGLILLASYTAADLRESPLSALTIYGSKDEIMNRERYAEGLTKLPQGYEELAIEGGCHAFFGMYNGQDGAAAEGITNAEQLQCTAEAIVAFVGVRQP